jgi:hypothetical protein
MPSATRTLGSFAAIGSAVYYSGGAYPPTPGNPALLEVYYGPAVAATASPTPSPTSARTPAPTYSSCGAECWATRNSLPIASANGAQACAAVGSLVYMHQYDAPTPVSGEGFHKYDSATDTWAPGGRPVPARTTTTSRQMHAHAHMRASTQPRTCGCRECRRALQMLCGIAC